MVGLRLVISHNLNATMPNTRLVNFFTFGNTNSRVERMSLVPDGCYVVSNTNALIVQYHVNLNLSDASCRLRDLRLCQVE